MSDNTRIREVLYNGDVSYFDIETRADLEAFSFQAALGRVRREKEKSVLGCGCLGGGGVWPPLGHRAGIGRLLCVRKRVDQHSLACCLGKIYNDQPKLPLSSSLFSATGLCSPESSAEQVGASDWDRAVDCLPFHGFATGTAALAGTDAFCAANSVAPPRSQPRTGLFLEAWSAVLRKNRFSGGRDAIAAARTEGVELLVGVVFDFPDSLTDTDGPGLLNGFWWAGRSLNAKTVTLSAAVLHAGSGRLRLWRGTLPPPYLVMATVEPSGVVRHLWMQGIWTDGLRLVCVASGVERHFAEKIRRAGGVIFVPLLKADLDRLAILFPPRTVQLVWEYRPDAVVWWPDSAKTVKPVVVENRGFKPGDEMDYDRKFELKRPWYGALVPWVDFYVEEGWRDSSGGVCFGRHLWKSPVLQPGAFSRAAHARWLELLGRLATIRTENFQAVDG